MNAAQLFTAAQALSSQEREMLCTRLAETLDTQLSPEEQAWAEVAERRAAELRSGKTQGVPADEVFAKARRALGL